MKIAFIGKGGSGKTTVCGLMARFIAGRDKNVLAIDADINQHLGSALGFSDAELSQSPKLDDDQQFIKDFFRGTNQRIRPASMFKTTPPGPGSRLVGVGDGNPIETRFGISREGVTLLSCGMHREDDIGVHCYHGKTAVVDIILNHTVDSTEDYLLVDMTAGADAFSSSLFSRFDLLVLVVEPTLKSVAVLRQYEELGKSFSLPLIVVGNKVSSEEDSQFLIEHTGSYLIATIGVSRFVRQLDRGIVEPIDQLEQQNAIVLDKILQHAALQKKDWDKYLAQLLEIHRRIGPAWGAGAPSDLLEQIDPEFHYPEQPNWREVVELGL